MDDFRLRIFSVLARTGSFTATARELGITQPAVSQRIAELEKETGYPLFDRAPGNVSLNEHGKVFFAYSERILHLYDAATQAFVPAGSLPRTLTLAADDALRTTVLPRLLPSMMELSSQTHIIIVPYSPATPADIRMFTAPARESLSLEHSAALCGSVRAVATGAQESGAPLLVWSGYLDLLSPEDKAFVRVSLPDPMAVLALAAARPECRALVPETALNHEKIHPQCIESLRMDRFIEASGDWARTQLYYFLENTTV